VLFCLDTGHLTLGGTDPAGFAEMAGTRVAHAHMKDVDDTLGAQLRSAELELVPAVKAGVFRVLGEGDAPISETVRVLEKGGYGGWYVLEQDTSVRSADPGADEGPAEDVRRSLAYLEELLDGAQA